MSQIAGCSFFGGITRSTHRMQPSSTLSSNRCDQYSFRWANTVSCQPRQMQHKTFTRIRSLLVACCNGATEISRACNSAALNTLTSDGGSTSVFPGRGKQDSPSALAYAAMQRNSMLYKYANKSRAQSCILAAASRGTSFFSPKIVVRGQW